MTRVTLDSNVYLSGFVFGGKPKRVLEMAIDGEIEVAVADPIIQEVRRHLLGKFGSRNRARRTPSRASRNSLKEPVTKPRPARVLGGVATASAARSASVSRTSRPPERAIRYMPRQD